MSAFALFFGFLFWILDSEAGFWGFHSYAWRNWIVFCSLAAFLL